MEDSKPPTIVTQEPAAPYNPLKSYYRQPKIYVKLPSKGRFYPKGALDISESGEYAVFAMTAKDELMFKTPDALMSGQSTIEVIKSCIPSITDPWQMPSIDVDAVLIAIRIATYGDKMGISAICPKCSEVNEYDLMLVSYLENLYNFEYQQEINIGPLVIIVKPYNYREVTKAAIKASEQEKIFSIINDVDLSDDEKVAQFGESFLKLTDLTVGLIANAIEKIITPDSEVTDRDFINDFIANAPKETFKEIKDHLDKMATQLEIKSQDVVCAECKHKFTTSITMDKSNFFDVRS